MPRRQTSVTVSESGHAALRRLAAFVVKHELGTKPSISNAVEVAAKFTARLLDRLIEDEVFDWQDELRTVVAEVASEHHGGRRSFARMAQEDPEHTLELLLRRRQRLTDEAKPCRCKMPNRARNPHIPRAERTKVDSVQHRLTVMAQGGRFCHVHKFDPLIEALAKRLDRPSPIA